MRFRWCQESQTCGCGCDKYINPVSSTLLSSFPHLRACVRLVQKLVYSSMQSPLAEGLAQCFSALLNKASDASCLDGLVPALQSHQDALLVPLQRSGVSTAVEPFLHACACACKAMYMRGLGPLCVPLSRLLLENLRLCALEAPCFSPHANKSSGVSGEKNMVYSTYYSSSVPLYYKYVCFFRPLLEVASRLSIGFAPVVLRFPTGSFLCCQMFRSSLGQVLFQLAEISSCEYSGMWMFSFPWLPCVEFACLLDESPWRGTRTGGPQPL